tara:strand:- start:7 stop:627 length:621 start_codon:yes stop_codon:yes gene_type:complete
MSIVKLNNNGVKNATAFGSITGLGSMTFIKKLTASSSSALSFVDGSSDVVLDNTYKEYIFTFKHLHLSSNTASIFFNGSIDSGSNYNVTKTTTNFEANHNEGDTNSQVAYKTARDLAQSTSDQIISNEPGNDNDQCMSGYMHLFNPSSTTFVKHFVLKQNSTYKGDYTVNVFIGGYFNTTSAIDAITFKPDSGTIDAGDICLYGIA